MTKYELTGRMKDMNADEAAEYGLTDVLDVWEDEDTDPILLSIDELEAEDDGAPL